VKEFFLASLPEPKTNETPFLSIDDEEVHTLPPDESFFFPVYIRYYYKY